MRKNSIKWNDVVAHFAPEKAALLWHTFSFIGLTETDLSFIFSSGFTYQTKKRVDSFERRESVEKLLFQKTSRNWKVSILAKKLSRHHHLIWLHWQHTSNGFFYLVNCCISVEILGILVCFIGVFSRGTRLIWVMCSSLPCNFAALCINWSKIQGTSFNQPLTAFVNSP